MRKRTDTNLLSEVDSSGRSILGIHPATAGTNEGVTGLDRWLVRRLLDLVGRPAISIVLWNREQFTPDGVTPVARMVLRSRRALYRLLLEPEFHFGDLYCSKALEVEGSLVEFLQQIYRSAYRSGGPRYAGLLSLIGQLRRSNNSLARSRLNIHHHYDIGNEFYSLWLDREAMQYTCAYFPDPALDLEQAQLAKMHHVCRKLRLQTGQTVVEAGCGWGGLARFMAREYGVRVRAYNISREQISYARKQAHRQGLDGQVEYVEDDYRNISGEYDAFVSIGMLEHVGIENYRELGEVINRCLRPDGRGLLHTIGRNEPGLMNAWIEARIFPGACPPSLGQMMEIFEPRSFSVHDVENLRLHYARTLECWLQRFEHNAGKVQSTYDESFTRAWRLYLSGSIAAFLSGRLQLFQVLFARAENNAQEWSRAHMYRS